MYLESMYVDIELSVLRIPVVKGGITICGDCEGITTGGGACTIIGCCFVSAATAVFAAVTVAGFDGVAFIADD